MNTHDVTACILEQRRQRYPAFVPVPGNGWAAPCRIEGWHLRVAFASAAPGRASDLVAAVLRYAATYGYDIHWTVIPTRPGEGELRDALAGAGFHDDESQCLMAHEGPLGAPVNPNVTVAPITTAETMLAYEIGSRGAFYDDPFPVRALVERRATERLLEQQRGWYRYFAAYLDGKQVGGAYFSRFEPVPTIMGVYTVPGSRGQGVATTLLETLVRTLIAEGSPQCCLYVRHGNPAQHLYARLGFVPLLDEFTLVNKVPRVD